MLDEPTNHLDIASREWVEGAVEQFGGTLLFVSHDRYFINKFATRIWELEGGVITDYPYGFEKYRSVKAMEERDRESRSAAAAAAEKKEKKEKKPAAKSGRGQGSARRQLTVCERDIARLEEQMEALDGQMEEYACDYEKLAETCREKEALQQQLDALYARWEQLAEEAEGS